MRCDQLSVLCVNRCLKGFTSNVSLSLTHSHKHTHTDQSLQSQAPYVEWRALMACCCHTEMLHQRFGKCRTADGSWVTAARVKVRCLSERSRWENRSGGVCQGSNRHRAGRNKWEGEKTRGPIKRWPSNIALAHCVKKKKAIKKQKCF